MSLNKFKQQLKRAGNKKTAETLHTRSSRSKGVSAQVGISRRSRTSRMG